MAEPYIGVPIPKASGPGIDQVNSYQKIMKTGRAVVVRNYQRRTIDQTIRKSVFLGRPAIAAKPGTFAGNRTTPGLWRVADVALGT